MVLSNTDDDGALDVEKFNNMKQSAISAHSFDEVEVKREDSGVSGS